MPTHRNEKEGYRRALRALRLHAEAKAMPSAPLDKMMRAENELIKAGRLMRGGMPAANKWFERMQKKAKK